jgi:predicted AlkP superfamily pyrophosphatase or phosphodiesterase
MKRSLSPIPAMPGSSFNRNHALEGANQVEGAGRPSRLPQSAALWARCGSTLAWIACVFCAQAAVAAETPKSERHVVVVVWDGMRPDFVSQENTPALWKLANEGVVFRNHHAVYPSATNVNGTAIATGAYPGHSGLIANHDYRPEIDSRKSLDVEIPAVVEKGDELSGGKYISFPTIAEIVQRAGGRTAIATAKTVGLLLDRHLDPGHAKNSVTVFAGASRPRDALNPIVHALGPFPPFGQYSEGDKWTTKALTEFLWKDGVPIFSLLWLGDPDLTQHQSAPGAQPALAAIKSSDENLASVLLALDRQGARETTDVFVVSDHGFSTIERSVDLRKILNDAGFTAKTEFTDEPKPGDIMLVGNGGTVLFYVINHDAPAIGRLVEFLQQSDFAGVIFTKEAMEGTFVLDQAKIESDHAPDVVMAFRWKEKKNQFGVPGMIDADWQRAAGKGTHATLSRFDMHNTLIAAGPDFRRGYTNELPSGNVDLAPTILCIFGITPPQPVDGRILSEAMVNKDAAMLKPETRKIEARKDFSAGTWRQSLQISRVGSTEYLNEGNGGFTPRKK